MLKRSLSLARRSFRRLVYRERRNLSILAEKEEKEKQDLRLYLETAVQDEWETLLPLGIFHGITTNPLLMQQAGVSYTSPVYPELRELIRTAVDKFAVNKIFVQAWGSSKDELVRTGLIARMFDRHVVVSVPFTFEGTQAAAELIEKGASVCMTAGHAQKQAIMGSALKADYFSPNVEAINASGEDALAQCIAMQQVIDGVKSNTRIMASGIQSADEVVELAKSGIKTFSVSPAVAYELVNHPLTCKVTDEFERITQGIVLEGRQ
mmetsp:Transcript_21069/g.31407  ORF Transcript_21069/g.31407 Transcript_21069/m.31407 type:complete len:265 (+) Transcript_21069:90-884(+)